MITTLIPPHDLGLAWPGVAPLLEPAAARSANRPDGCGRSVDWVLARLIAGDAQLWAVHDGSAPFAAVVTQITLGPADEGKRCLLWLIGARRHDRCCPDIRLWGPQLLPSVESWARRQGCIALWGAGRAGWARMVRRFGGRFIGVVDGTPAWERRIA